MKTDQPLLPGMEEVKLKKPKHLHELYLLAACEYWGPIATKLEAEGKIGPEGLKDEDMEGYDFISLDEFAEQLKERGIEYRL